MRPSLPSLLALIAIVTLAFLSAGCVNSSRRASSNRVAVALTVNGTEQPNAEQWANVIAALKPALAAQGLVLVNDLADADRILRIDFTPSLTTPNSAGHAVFLGWRINPLRALTYAANPRTSLSYVNYSSGLSAYHNSTYGFDRYADYSYSYGHGGGVPSPTTTAPPPDKTGHPGKHRQDLPPGTPPPERHGPGRFVGVDPHPHPHPGNRPHPDHPPRPASSDGPSSYSSPTGSSSYSSSSSSYSSSGSSSSYSSAGGSGFSGSSGSSVSSSPSSSGSTSSGSSGTYESRAQRQN